MYLCRLVLPHSLHPQQGCGSLLASGQRTRPTAPANSPSTNFRVIDCNAEDECAPSPSVHKHRPVSYHSSGGLSSRLWRSGGGVKMHRADFYSEGLKITIAQYLSRSVAELLGGHIGYALNIGSFVQRHFSNHQARDFQVYGITYIFNILLPPRYNECIDSLSIFSAQKKSHYQIQTFLLSTTKTPRENDHFNFTHYPKHHCQPVQNPPHPLPPPPPRQHLRCHLSPNPFLLPWLHRPSHRLLRHRLCQRPPRSRPHPRHAPHLPLPHRSRCPQSQQTPDYRPPRWLRRPSRRSHS